MDSKHQRPLSTMEAKQRLLRIGQESGCAELLHRYPVCALAFACGAGVLIARVSPARKLALLTLVINLRRHGMRFSLLPLALQLAADSSIYTKVLRSLAANRLPR